MKRKTGDSTDQPYVNRRDDRCEVCRARKTSRIEVCTEFAWHITDGGFSTREIGLDEVVYSTMVF